MFSAVLVEHRLVSDTDRQTDRQTDGHRAIAYTTLAQRRAVKASHLGIMLVWPGGVLVGALDLRPRRSPVLTARFQVTTLGKLFTHMCLCHREQYNLVSVKGW